MEPENERQFYTIPEAARILDVSQATVWRWIEAERLPAYRVGPRRIRIKREDLELVIRPVRGKEETAKKEKEPQDIWANYDPNRVRQALQRSAGALAGVDRHKLLADIQAAREQESKGRPA